MAVFPEKAGKRRGPQAALPGLRLEGDHRLGGRLRCRHLLGGEAGGLRQLRQGGLPARHASCPLSACALHLTP